MGVVGRLDQYASMLAWEFDDYSISENLFLYSEQYNQSNWIKQGSTISQNAITAPDGLGTADKLIGNNGVTTRQSVYQQVNVTSGVTYTFSVFLKQAERRYGCIWFDNANITEGAFYGAGTYFDLQTGTIIGTQNTKIVAYPNGWYRIYVTATPSFTGALSLNTSIGTPNNASDGAGTIAYQYTGDGVSGFYIWGSQVETGTNRTDYTPTTTTAKTRVLSSTTNTNITGLGTYYSSGFDENVGFTTFLSANISPPYDPVYDEFGGTLFGAGQGRYMRQNTDKSVIVYNEIDEITDFYGRGVVRDGLVLDLDAGISASYAGIGTTWTDLSATNSQAILQNSPTFIMDNSGILDFDGTDDYADATSSAYNLGVGTIEVWVKADAPTDNLNQQIFARTNTSAGTFNIFKNITNLFQFSIRLTTNTQYNIGSDSNATTNWTHIVGTYDGAIQKMFVNTTQQSTTNTISGTLNISGTLAINIARQTTGTALFNGKIAAIRVYNRALTASEISQNYNALKNRFGL
jgi:hypothetical protein